MHKAKQALGLLEGNRPQRRGWAGQFAMSPAEPWDQVRWKAVIIPRVEAGSDNHSTGEKIARHKKEQASQLCAAVFGVRLRWLADGVQWLWFVTVSFPGSRGWQQGSGHCLLWQVMLGNVFILARGALWPYPQKAL